MLDIVPLSNALRRLEEGLVENKRIPESEFVRDAVIQRFEFTYDLSIKLLRKFLIESESIEAGIDQMSFKHLIRVASERGLTPKGLDQWSLYRDSRNISSHTYDQTKAYEVLSKIPAFYEDAVILRDRMTEHLNA